jgi:nucleoside-triphosphatase THEP1
MFSSTPFVVLTGVSGAGKTTLCQALATRARDAHVGVGGVLSERRIEQGRVVGLDLVNAANGDRLPLAEPDVPTDGPTVGCWHFHAAAVAAGLSWGADVRAGELFVIDEVGPLELDQHLGWSPLIPQVRDHAGPALVVVRPALVDRFLALMASRTARTVEITAGCRSEGQDAVAGFLGCGTW